ALPRRAVRGSRPGQRQHAHRGAARLHRVRLHRDLLQPRDGPGRAAVRLGVGDEPRPHRRPGPAGSGARRAQPQRDVPRAGGRRPPGRRRRRAELAREAGDAVTTVRLFAALKLRLLAGNLRGDLTRKLGFVFTLVMAVFLAALGFFLMSVVRFAPPDIATDIVIVVFSLFLVSWMIGPLLAFGLDDTLDPARLALFPLPTRQLAVGMFTASATGVWPLASLVVTAGALVALVSSLGGFLLGILAVLLQFALCLVASRLVTTSLSGALRTRRGRDVLAVAAFASLLLFQLPNLLLNSNLGDPLSLLRGTADLLRWTPSGMTAHAIADGGLTGLGELLVVALVVA